MQDMSEVVNQLLDAWESAAHAEDAVRAYDIANLGIEKTDHPSFYCAKFISLLALNKAFNPWRSVYMTVLGRRGEEYSKSDLKELLNCGLAFVEREQSGRSYECLGRARALQTLELNDGQREEKISICKQALNDLERSHQLYLVEQELAKTRELKETLSTDIRVVLGLANELKEEIQKPDKGSKGGCFIATAAMGNENAGEVVFLKQFRDQKLLLSLWGKIFIHCYYSFSPLVAKYIAESTVLRKLTMKIVVKPLVWAVKTFYHLK